MGAGRTDQREAHIVNKASEADRLPDTVKRHNPHLR